MGTPEFSVPTLQSLLSFGHDIRAVYTQPPRPAGRGKKDKISPVHCLAELNGLTVKTPHSLKNDGEQQYFEALRLDAAIVVAYGLILPKAFLEAPRLGCINIHASILPRWRGAAPIQRAIMAGDSKTGITIMQMDEQLDTSTIFTKSEVEITEHTDDVYSKLDHFTGSKFQKFELQKNFGQRPFRSLFMERPRVQNK